MIFVSSHWSTLLLNLLLITQAPTPRANSSLVPNAKARSNTRREKELFAVDLSGLGGKTKRVAWSFPKEFEAAQMYCPPGLMSSSWLDVRYCPIASWESENEASPSRTPSGAIHWTSGRGEPWTWHTALKPDVSLPSADKLRIRGAAGNDINKACQNLRFYSLLMHEVEFELYWPNWIGIWQDIEFTELLQEF